jgi:hypothetical protein
VVRQHLPTVSRSQFFFGRVQMLPHPPYATHTKVALTMTRPIERPLMCRAAAPCGTFRVIVTMPATAQIIFSDLIGKRDYAASSL